MDVSSSFGFPLLITFCVGLFYYIRVFLVNFFHLILCSLIILHGAGNYSNRYKDLTTATIFFQYNDWFKVDQKPYGKVGHFEITKK